MPLKPDEFEKLERKYVYGITCLCGSLLIVGISPKNVRCWKCKRRWKIHQRMATLVGLVRKRKCKILPNWTTNKFGQCERKSLCESQGRKCSAIIEVHLIVRAIR